MSSYTHESISKGLENDKQSHQFRLAVIICTQLIPNYLLSQSQILMLRVLGCNYRAGVSLVSPICCLSWWFVFGLCSH